MTCPALEFADPMKYANRNASENYTTIKGVVVKKPSLAERYE